jgi:ferric-dicitrate binding protein FerR (iron transport regulator)
MARRRYLCVCIVLLLALPGVAGKKEHLPVGTAKAAVISAMLREAQVLRRSQPTLPRIKARYGMELAWNDVVQTDPNGRVRVRMLDDSLLSIGANSELRITSHDSQTHRTKVELAYGRLRAQIKKLAAGEEFEVRTPTAVAGVIGTDFGIDASDPRHVKFICLEGTVRISSVNPDYPGTLNCEGGHSVTMDEGKAPNAPLDADTAQMARWRRITDPDTPDY